MSLYVDRPSIVHRIDPMNKLMYILASVAVPAILSNAVVALFCSIVSVSLLLIGKVFKRALVVYGFVLFVLFTVVIIHGLFNPANETLLFTLGPLAFYREGVLHGLAITLRVVNIVGAFLILVLTTKPSDLVETLVRKGLSPRIGYVLASVFQIVPDMIASVKTISDAQRARGMETEGKLRVRIKAFFPLIGPVVLNSLIGVRERAMALEVRGFNTQGDRTFLHEAKEYVATKAIQWSLWGVIAAAVVWRVML